MQKTILRCGIAGLALAICVALAPSAYAEMVPFKASLKGKGKGHGTVSATYETSNRILSWRVNYSGLSGPATAAHFHGPAKAGENAGVQIPMMGNLNSPIVGQVAIADSQLPDLMAGLYYFNVHTKANPPGEIRGQLVKGK